MLRRMVWMSEIRQFYVDIESILKKGIELGSDSDRVLKLTARKISSILNTGHSPYIAYVDPDGATIHIETSYFDPVLSVEVTKGNIFFIPLIDTDWHGAFFEILKIIYLFEQKEIKEEELKRKDESPDFDWI